MATLAKELIWFQFLEINIGKLHAPRSILFKCFLLTFGSYLTNCLEKRKTLVFFPTSGNIWCKCLRKCESCLWWGNYWKISSFCLSINSMISPIEGQKSNFKICILRVFILAIMLLIRNVVYSVTNSFFSELAFHFPEAREMQSPISLYFDSKISEVLQCQRKQFLLPISSALLPPRKILSPPKQLLKIHFSLFC